jgi:hypothetical protein
MTTPNNFAILSDLRVCSNQVCYINLQYENYEDTTLVT